MSDTVGRRFIMPSGREAEVRIDYGDKCMVDVQPRGNLEGYSRLIAKVFVERPR